MAESQNFGKVFLPDQEEVLIEEARKNPVLYDLLKTSHNDIILKDETWKNISLKVGRSVDDCKRRWKNIKDTYNRNKMKLGTGSASLSKKKWILADRASFLNSMDNERSSNIDTLLNEDGSIGTDNSNKDDNIDLLVFSFVDNLARSKTDKLTPILAKNTQDEQNEQLLNANKNEEDDTDLFFKSIALAVKKLPTKGINEAKIKTLMFINELQEKYANLPQITPPGFFPIQNFQQNQQHYYGVSNPQNKSPISYSDSDRSQTSSGGIIPAYSMMTKLLKSQVLKPCDGYAISPAVPYTKLQKIQVLKPCDGYAISPAVPYTKLQKSQVLKPCDGYAISPAVPYTKLQKIQVLKPCDGYAISPAVPYTKLQKIQVLKPCDRYAISPAVPYTKLQKSQVLKPWDGYAISPAVPYTKLQKTHTDRSQTSSLGISLANPMITKLPESQVLKPFLI